MRTHLILVPGFGGFDSLGQLNYYAGVTDACTAWRAQGRGDLGIHYFDNLPTASVATRAKKLKLYVEKLVRRGVIRPEDRIVLGGHSTGGLDIRQVVIDLRKEDTFGVLPLVHRLAYLSVPQRGTNIAEWLLQADVAKAGITQLLRRAIGLSTTSPLYAAVNRFDFLLRWAVRGRPELMDAVEDARRDADTSVTDPYEHAEARRSRAEIDLWLTHAADDFLALDDLSSQASDAKRLVEQATWIDPSIKTRSYATLGHNPFGELPTGLASYPQIFKAAHEDRPDTDGVYRLAYRACAGGSFRARGISVPWLATCRPAWASATYQPTDSDNDGIVNTASMIEANDSFLVPGDHADIIGHFKKRPVEKPAADRRQYERYDLLASASAPAFENIVFKAVWFDLFDFAVS